MALLCGSLLLMKQEQENWDVDIETEDDHSERVSFRQVMRLHDAHTVSSPRPITATGKGMYSSGRCLRLTAHLRMMMMRSGSCLSRNGTTGVCSMHSLPLLQVLALWDFVIWRTVEDRHHWALTGRSSPPPEREPSEINISPRVPLHPAPPPSAKTKVSAA